MTRGKRTAPACIIREFQAGDYESVAELWIESNIRVDPLEDVRRKRKRDPELFLVAAQGGQIVGAVMGAYDGRFVSINRLAVAPQVRRKGLASRLIREIEKRAMAKGARRVWAWIVDENAASRSLFAECGYEEWGHVVTVTKALL